MASALDKSVGAVVSALDDSDMLRNSIIVFSADNGGAVEGIDDSTGSNWPLRGSKYNLWEGGIRGTAFIWSPLLPYSKGYISEDLMHISDWLPTLYTAAGEIKYYYFQCLYGFIFSYTALKSTGWFQNWIVNLQMKR